MKVLNLCPVPPEAFSHNLDPALGIEVVNPAEHSMAAAIAVAGDVDLVVGDYSGQVGAPSELVRALRHARHYHQFTVGYDLVDVGALTAAGIPMTNAGDAAAVAMAEHSVMAALALLKSTAWSDRQVRAGGWPQHEVVGRSLVELRSATVGLIGFGAAARETADRLRPFGCTVLYTARTRRPPETEAAHGVGWRALDDLLTQSTVVIVLADLNPSTHHLLDADRLARMPRGSFLINPSRAQIVDTDALATALRDGHLRGAAVDVADVEPPGPGWPLRDLEDVLLTPHTGGATLETRMAMMSRTFQVITDVAAGRDPGGILNGVTASPADVARADGNPRPT